MIDRLGPRLRPDEQPVGRQSWRHLLFLHWIVPAERLRQLVPRSFELDLLEGHAYVGIVPFEMRNVRFAGWPWPVVRDFGETNVRTYVTHRGRPGVYFFSLEASSRLAVRGARWGWGLPYHFAQIAWHGDPRNETVHYEAHRNRSAAYLQVDYRVAYDRATELRQPRASALADFLLERYLLFLERNGRVWSGQVHHVPYPWHSVEVFNLRGNLIESAGLEQWRHDEVITHWSPGVDVELFGLRREA